MKIADYLQFSLKNIFRSKNKIYFIIVFIICTIICSSILLFDFNYNDYIEKAFNENIGFRSIMVTPKLKETDYGLSEIKDIPNIIDIHSSKYDFIPVESDLKNSVLDGYLDLNYGTKNTLPTKIIGKSFDQNDSGVAICPINFYPSSTLYSLEIDEKEVLNGHDLLNESFKIKYYSYLSSPQGLMEEKEYSKEFKIVGIYDNKENLTTANTCYISKRDIENIVDTGNLNKDSVSSFLITVDNIVNINSVKTKLSEKGFNFEIKNTVDNDMVKTISFSSQIVLAIILLTIALLTTFYVKKKVKNNRNIIGVLRACGYQKKDIRNLYIMEISILCLGAFFIGTLFTTILFIIFKHTILNFLLFYGFEIQLKFLSYVITFFFINIIPILISIIFINQELNHNIEILLESGD